MNYLAALLIAAALLWLLGAAAREGRRQGFTRWMCACGHLEPSPDLRDYHEANCDICRRINKRTEETP